MKKIKKHLKWITLGIILIVISSSILIKYSLSTKKTEEIKFDELELKEQEDNEKEAKTEESIKEETPIETVYVDIKGAVKAPGVYEIASDKKVIDVVGLAGGLKENADTSLINLAKKVTNEMVVIIYTKEEIKKATEDEPIIKIIEKECNCPAIKNDACLEQNKNQDDNAKDDTELGDDKININTATIEELQKLSGIGESKAKTIIEYREKNGKFEKIEDLIEVTGIGEALYEKIKNNITV